MSPSAKKPYGILRVCRAWRLARATVQRHKALADGAPRIPAKRGPKTFLSDDEILAAYRLLASTEGLFCEPSSAAGVAGLLKMKSFGALDPGQVIVVTLTGNGLKDPQWALDSAPEPIVVPVDVKEAARALGLTG